MLRAFERVARGGVEGWSRGVRHGRWAGRPAAAPGRGAEDRAGRNPPTGRTGPPRCRPLMSRPTPNRPLNRSPGRLAGRPAPLSTHRYPLFQYRGPPHRRARTRMCRGMRPSNPARTACAAERPPPPPPERSGTGKADRRPCTDHPGSARGCAWRRDRCSARRPSRGGRSSWSSLDGVLPGLCVRPGFRSLIRLQHGQWRSAVVKLTLVKPIHPFRMRFDLRTCLHKSPKTTVCEEVATGIARGIPRETHG